MFASYSRKKIYRLHAFDGSICLLPTPHLQNIAHPLQTALVQTFMSFDEVGKGKKWLLKIGNKKVTFLQYFIGNFIPQFWHKSHYVNVNSIIFFMPRMNARIFIFRWLISLKKFCFHFARASLMLSKHCSKPLNPIAGISFVHNLEYIKWSKNALWPCWRSIIQSFCRKGIKLDVV